MLLQGVTSCVERGLDVLDPTVGGGLDTLDLKTFRLTVRLLLPPTPVPSSF